MLAELKKMIGLLVNSTAIPIKYRDHELKGYHEDIRELQLKPNDLLLYMKKDEEKITLMALGSHLEFFCIKFVVRPVPNLVISF